MALPTVLLKAKSAISKGTKAVKTAKAVKSTTSNSNEEEVKTFLSVFKIPLFLATPIVLFVVLIFLIIVSTPDILHGYVSDLADGNSDSSGGNYGGDIGYIQWAVDIANDDSHGYSQCKRNGPDYDCSSLVYYSLLNSGYSQAELGDRPFNTGTESAVLTRIGFVRHTYVESELQPGDILWKSGHTGMYVGDGQVVEAQQNENGKVCGGESGDQTGSEIIVHANPGQWTAYFRNEG